MASFWLRPKAMMSGAIVWSELVNYPILLNVVVVLAAAIIGNAIARRAFDHHLKRTKDSGRRTGIFFMRNAVTAVILIAATLAIIYSIPSLRSLAVGVFAGASVLAAFLGFASQKAFSNIVSGVFIVVFKPFRVDDIIKIDGQIGTIEDITLRHTVIRALENKRLIYPNSVIDSEALINWTITDKRAQKFMFISIGYEADLEAAVAIIREEATKHPDLLDERTAEEKAQGVPLVDVPVLDFQNSMINFRIPLWAKDLPTAMRLTWDVQRAIKLKFDQAGIPLGRPSQVNFEGAELRSLRADAS
jgi:small conductance mechanosensitive channel